MCALLFPTTWETSISFVLCCLYQAKDAAMYGRGSYFAERAAYSHGSFVHKVDADDTYQLLLTRVVCGKAHDFGEDIQQVAKPPPPCHSVVGGPHTAFGYPEPTRMWIVYDLSQAYPQYIVTYKTTMAVGRS